MRTILLIGYLGAENLGDECMLRQFLSLFTPRDNVHFRILSLGTNYNTEQITTFCYSPDSFSLKQQYMKALSGADAVVWVGGNCFTDHDCDGGFMLLLLAKLHGKKFYYCGVGIDKLERLSRKIKTFLALHIADGVIVRDAFSCEFARRRLVGSHKLTTGMDLGDLFLLKQRGAYLCSSDHIAVSWRELEKNLGAGRQQALTGRLADYLVTLSRRLHKSLMIFNTDQITDRRIHANLITELENRAFHSYTYREESSLEEKLAIMASAYCVVTARMHTAAAGYVFAKPVLLLNYSQKTIEYAHDKPGLFLLSENMVELPAFDARLDLPPAGTGFAIRPNEDGLAAYYCLKHTLLNQPSDQKAP